jgi:hypothetical protein
VMDDNAQAECLAAEGAIDSHFHPNRIHWRFR